MKKTNIKLEHDEFVTIFYDTYHRLRKSNLFEEGYEDFAFKIWKHADSHFILVKIDGMLIQWDKILSYKLCSSKKLTRDGWVKIVEALMFNLDEAGIATAGKDAYELGERL